MYLKFKLKAKYGKKNEVSERTAIASVLRGWGVSLARNRIRGNRAKFSRQVGKQELERGLSWQSSVGHRKESRFYFKDNVKGL